MPTGKIVYNINEVFSELNKLSSSLKKYGYEGGGALVIFIGYVKGVVEGKKVFSLEYEAYEPLASEKLKEIALSEASTDGVLDIAIYHLVGELKPGDPAVYIAVYAVSRGEAFATARRVLERIKKEVPIFKLEKREDGEFWVIGDRRRIRRELSQS